MNVISFGLWGSDPLYCRGMIENLRLAPVIYPGWRVWVWHDDTLPRDVAEYLADMAEVLCFSSRGKWDGLFRRFLPNVPSSQVDRFIVRDADSRLNVREAAAVNEWIESGKPFHAMRDHIDHNVPIMGGMWGATKGCLPELGKQIAAWGRFDAKGDDQQFLADIVWPLVRDRAIVHDRYPDGAIRLPYGQIVTLPDTLEYNAWDNCGAAHREDFPRGRVVLKSGETFDRMDCYTYRPTDFGPHDVRPFPTPPPIDGDYVGRQVRPE